MSVSDSQDGASALPKHIAIIMDGNNRWAKREGVASSAGHRAGVEAVREVLGACLDNGVSTLTLFAFSSENWGRPRPEVRALLALLMRYLRNEVKQLHSDGVCLRFMGARAGFSQRLQKLMSDAEALTANNTRATLVIAVDYGGRWDIAQAARQLARKVAAGEISPDSVDEHSLGQQLDCADIPAPDLCIRTGGDTRISNFMLWQFAYTELYFTETLWPDFDRAAFAAALTDFGLRERRFGLR
ncbi:MAG: di-trans,poly-cis-decaprenylcistransferase [Gammaproteobacteria bacterium]|nr:MAG: di-trans,poly-cis-decaprenylcistransferase [Gammaproteobacteria bacterium]